MTTAVLNAGTTVNVVTVSGHDDENTSATASDTHTLAVSDVAPTISVDKSATNIAEGNTATYSFVITNTSSVSTDPVTITSVSDDVLGDLTSAALAANGGNPIVLAPGASFSFSYTTAVLNAGTTVNVVTVSGHDDENTSATASDTHTLSVSDVAPTISVDKTVDANGDGIFQDSESVPAGMDKVVIYKYVVTNVSQASTDLVTITTLSDDKAGDILTLGTFVGGDTNSNQKLDKSESWAYTISYTVPAGIAGGSYINTITAQGKDDDGTLTNEVTDTATVTFTTAAAPAITFTKDASPTIAKPYQPVTYTYTVGNTGGTAINGSDIVIVDDNGTPTFPGDDFTPPPVLSGGFNSGDANHNNKLDPGESWYYSKTLIPPVSTISTTVVGGTNVTAGVVIITEVLDNGNIRATYLQDFGVNDNTYGTGAIGWPNGHKFGDLVGSDKLEFQFYDAAGNVAIDFYVDTISQATSGLNSTNQTLYTYPAGYGTLGPFGGDGFMVSGDPAHVVGYSTSITTNLNNPLNVPNKAALIVNSPTSLDSMGNVVVDTTKAPGGWDYINSYTVEVSAAAFAAGGGFGACRSPTSTTRRRSSASTRS